MRVESIGASDVGLKDVREAGFPYDGVGRPRAVSCHSWCGCHERRRSPGLDAHPPMSRETPR